MKLSFKKTFSALTILVLSTTILVDNAGAQVNILGAQYFNNQYLGNPALAGLLPEIQINVAYRKQWTSMPESPIAQVITADYGINRKVGIGLMVSNEQASLLNNTTVKGTYAYHLKLNDQQNLHFGLSFGFTKYYMDMSEIQGDQNDLNLQRYNDQDLYFDGDFGISYTYKKLNIQATIPNVRSAFKGDVNFNKANRAVFFTASSYKFNVDGDGSPLVLEPKICYRGIEGYDNILDAGLNVSYWENKVNIFGMYHSTESTTLGMGLAYNRSFSIFGLYNTEPAAARGVSSGGFELGLKLSL